MAFGHASLPSRIYSYRAKEPTENLDVVLEQLKLANTYRNKLVEIEIKRRADIKAERDRRFPNLLAIEERAGEIDKILEEKRKQLKANNAAARKRTPQPALQAEIKKLTEQRKAAWAEYKVIREQVNKDEALKEAWAKIDEDSHKTVLDARSKSGLYWGTYLCVEPTVSRTSPYPPVFHRFTGEGKIAVQIQKAKPLNMANLFLQTDQRIQVAPLPNNAWDKKAPPRLRRTIAKLRVKSGEKDAAIMTTMPLTMHRPLPYDANIKWVWLIRRRVATHFHWYLQFVVAKEEWPKEKATEKCVGIDVNWRKLPDGGVRVAVCIGTDGHVEEVIIPAYRLSGWKKVEDLQSIRSLNYNLAREQLAAFLTKAKTTVGEGMITLPEWLVEATKTLPLWKSQSQARLASVVLRWSANCFPGDEQILATLEAWRKQDKHLYEWQENQRRNMQNWRNGFYRVLAKRLRTRYKQAAIEDTDWSKLQRNKLPENASDEDKIIKHYQRVAAVGKLLEFVKESMETKEKPAAFSTKDCNVCEARCELSGQDVTHTCEHCGAVWDIDHNAARNLLKESRQTEPLAAAS